MAPGKRSAHELKRLVEEAVRRAVPLNERGKAFFVDAVEARGQPPHALAVSATLHFLEGGSPFCCREPGCHLRLFGDRLEAVEEEVRRAMGLRQRVSIDFGERIAVEVHAGVRFDDPRGSRT